MLILPSARRALQRFASAGLAVACVACAGRFESPREPFPQFDPEAVATVTGPPRASFQVLDDWQWSAVSGRSRAPQAVSALAQGRLGLFEADLFRATTGECTDCSIPEGISSWFRNEVIAVPETRDTSGSEIATDAAVAVPPRLPPLAWIGAPEILEQAELSRDAQSVRVGSTELGLVVAPRRPRNAAYVNADTAAFFSDGPLRIRGARTGSSTFVARTIWPEAARLDFAPLALDPLSGNEMLGTLIEAQVDGRPAFDTRLLFERVPGGSRRWSGKPVVAIVLSGAQGDDDAARGGHLGVATGIVGPNGEWSEWLVNNFYPLIERSAKGIVPAPVPMDNYLFDFNSGQLYYRPAYMLVAILGHERVAARVQDALQEMMAGFYCGEVDFDFAGFNSTAMAIEPLRDIGWRIPKIGPTSRIAGLLAAPIAALASRSLAAGRDVFSALSQERTSFLPRVAFEAAGHDLLHLAYRGDEERDLTAFERALVEDIEAVLFVRLPQVPSARRYGTYPVRSLLTYGAELLADPAPVEFAPEPEDRDSLRTAALCEPGELRVR